MQPVQGLVSITIPFYNSVRFLQEAIESVLAQEYLHWELFLVDDGSTDGSTELAQQYAAAHPDRIRYLEHPGHANLGVTRTRNLGVSMSRGEFLAFLDSDDCWLPHKLEDQVSLLQAHPEAGMVCAPSEYWFDWDQSAMQENYVPQIASSGVYACPVLLVSTHPLGLWGAPCPSSFLIRRSAFDMVGGFVEEFVMRKLYEDTAFLARIYLSNTQVVVSKTCSDRYRCHDASIWHTLKGTTQEELDRKYYFTWLRRFLVETNCEDTQIWRAVRKSGWMYWLPLPATVTIFLRRVAAKWRTWKR